MTETKTFKITGQITKHKLFIPIEFKKEIQAAKLEHALEKIYAEFGSRHRAKRSQITIISVEEVQKEETSPVN
ncbi:50S ribosomal protein L18a [Candidatus Bathyarchaeota archaeon]|nr:50S ribosomal protein L18a [Candidatus Bathyarchaeota archaeon]